MVAGFIAYGGFLDAVGNAMTFLQLWSPVQLSSVIVVPWVLAEIVVRKRWLRWGGESGSTARITKLQPALRAILLGAAVLPWVAQFNIWSGQPPQSSAKIANSAEVRAEMKANLSKVTTKGESPANENNRVKVQPKKSSTPKTEASPVADISHRHAAPPYGPMDNGDIPDRFLKSEAKAAMKAELNRFPAHTIGIVTPPLKRERSSYADQIARPFVEAGWTVKRYCVKAFLTEEAGVLLPTHQQINMPNIESLQAVFRAAKVPHSVVPLRSVFDYPISPVDCTLPMNGSSLGSSMTTSDYVVYVGPPYLIPAP